LSATVPKSRVSAGIELDNLMVIGFREALLAALQRKYVISPSSATIFTSELPSHLTTPTGTGANTPQPQMAPPQYYGQSSGVNPLLVAAVTSQAAHLNPHSGVLPSAQMQNVHSSHGQTPTSVKYAKPGEYFPEWKDVGFDEAQFLGAQVMAKVLFVVDQGQTKGFMTRNDYNDMGPTGITEFGP
jgi:actin-related protein 9